MNLGNVDRTARVLVGLIILIVSVVMQSWWGVLGLALIVTGTVGYCGAYSLFGITTCKLELPVKPVAPTEPVAPGQSGEPKQ